MDLYKNLSSRLASKPEEVLGALSDQLHRRSNLQSAVNLFKGLLEMSLPQFFLRDLPQWSQIADHKERYRDMARELLAKEAETVFAIILDTSVDEAVRRRLLALTTRHILQANIKPKTLVRFAALLLSIFMLENDKPIGTLAHKALCRLDMQKVLAVCDLSTTCQEVEPYPELTDWRKKHQNSPDFCAAEYLFTTPVLCLEQSLPDYAALCQSLPLENFTTITDCLKTKAIQTIKQTDLTTGQNRSEVIITQKSEHLLK